MVHSFRAAVAEARRHGDLYFAALLPQDRIHKAFGTARWLWQGWIYTPAVTVWVFLSQCLSPDHSCRDAVARLIAWRLAARLEAVFGRHRGLLHGARRSAGRSPSRIGARHRQAGRGRIAGDLALARAKGSRGGRVHHHHARHAGESGGLSAAENAEARLRLSHRPNPGDLFALGGHGVGGGDRKIQGQADRRKQLVSRALRCVGRRRHYPGGPLFQRLVRHCLAAGSAASTSSSASINSGARTFARASDWARTTTWFSGRGRNDRNGCRPSSTPRCPTS